MGTSKNNDTRYAAFISYAHADEVMAARLHKALETYPVPKHLRAEGKTTKPVFRDVAELTAAHSLSEKIRDAVKGSRVLIVLCSPAAKASHWVNEEIRLFRELHGDASILSAIIEGTPETAFPEALTEGGREPLAANLGGRKESFNLGVTQLAASILGVGLDQLIQRDAKRRRNRFRAFTAASMGFAAIMGGMAWMAVDARDAAEVSRSEAENMVEYLITDLKKELDVVGRLSILDDVGKRVTDYYDAIPLSDMDDERLTRQARARHILGEVAIKQGRLDHALTELTASYAATEEYLRRNPDTPDAIFAHAQSEYWVGKVYLEREEPEKALPSRIAYSELSKRLYDIDPNNRDYVFEYASSLNNMGYIYYELLQYDLSEMSYLGSIATLDLYSASRYIDQDVEYKKFRYTRNLAVTLHKSGRFDLARKKYIEQIDLLTGLLSNDSANALLREQLIIAQTWLQELKIKDLSECAMKEIIALESELEKMVRFDFSNEKFKSDYINLVYNSLNHCKIHIGKPLLNSMLINAESYYQSMNNPDKKMQDKYVWLSKLKARPIN